METDWHRRMKKKWAELGRSLGFGVKTEYAIGRDRIDVVWSFSLDCTGVLYGGPAWEDIILFCIEVEAGGNKKRQIRHNILKCGKLSPACVIIHFKDREKIKKYMDLKEQFTYPIVFTDCIMYEDLRRLRLLIGIDILDEEEIEQFPLLKKIER